MYRLIFIIVCSWFSFTSSVVVADKITANIKLDLNLRGFNAGPVDGVAGSKTISYLGAFYKDYGGANGREISSNDAEAVSEYAARYSSNRNPNKGFLKIHLRTLALTVSHLRLSGLILTLNIANYATVTIHNMTSVEIKPINLGVKMKKSVVRLIFKNGTQEIVCG